VQRVSFGAIVFGLIPFIGMCFSVPIWDRIDPMILGMPFSMFWLISWTLLTSVCMWVAYRLEESRAAHRSQTSKKDGTPE
jgi:Protein of unknown function (DUF3311)